MDPHAYNTLILSDLHLGAETSHAREATDLLKKSRFHRLILLGDIFADLNFARLNKDHWKFLGYIRKLSNPKRGIEVVWVEGNHDHVTDSRPSGKSVLVSVSAATHAPESSPTPRAQSPSRR